MPEILQVTMGDILRELPEPVPWDPSVLGDGGIQMLVCCAGFEDRSRAILDDIRDIPVGLVNLVVYPANAEENRASLEDFRSGVQTSRREEVGYDRAQFLKSCRELFTQLSDKEGVRVVIDVSGMASYVAYRVLAAVYEALPNAELGIYYAEAKDYSPSRREWMEFYDNVPDPSNSLTMAEHYEKTHFQSIGVDETYGSDVFPGRNVDPLATEVIAIPSFSLQRMKSMLAYAESQYSVPQGNIRWFLGQPPDRKKNGWRYEALAALYNVRNAGVAVSTLNYREILQRLDDVWEEHHTTRHFVIANMGSKMQHLGAFLFLRMHPECGLLLCEPERFIASRYSAGVGSKWWVDFGRVSDIDRHLASRGELRFNW
jgi:hypothetical protein